MLWHAASTTYPTNGFRGPTRRGPRYVPRPLKHRFAEGKATFAVRPAHCAFASAAFVPHSHGVSAARRDLSGELVTLTHGG